MVPLGPRGAGRGAKRGAAALAQVGLGLSDEPQPRDDVPGAAERRLLVVRGAFPARRGARAERRVDARTPAADGRSAPGDIIEKWEHRHGSVQDFAEDWARLPCAIVRHDGPTFPRGHCDNGVLRVAEGGLTVKGAPCAKLTYQNPYNVPVTQGAWPWGEGP